MELNKRQTLSDLIDNTFKMFGVIWKKILPMAAILFFPVAVLYLISMKWFFRALNVYNTMTHTVSRHSGDVLQMMGPLILPYCLLILGILLYYLAQGYATIFVARSVFNQGGKKTIAWGELLKQTLGSMFRYIGQRIIRGSVIFTVTLFVSIAIGVVIGLTAISKSGINPAHYGPFILGMVICLLLVYAFMLWFSVKMAFAVYSLAFDRNIGVFESLGQSFSLVKGQFWRVLGLILLVIIVLSFAVNIATGPFVFVFMLPGTIEMMKAMVNNSKDLISMLPHFYGSFSWGLALSIYLQAVATTMVYPIFMTMLFMDLKARK